MRVLVVCSKNSGRIAPFIVEQVESLIQAGLELDYFTIQGKGIIGYLKNFKNLRLKIKVFMPDIIHAHYGLSGLLSNFQRRVPVVTTYHGSDINIDKVYRFSKISIQLSAFNIFVSEKNMRKAGFLNNLSISSPVLKLRKKAALIPCGVDVDLFKPLDRNEAREKMRLDLNRKYILFAGAFENKVKNSTLAIEAVSYLNDEVELLELRGYSREQVAYLMNAVDCVLMTSFTEGSPQFIKEAMACNCPIVSVSVGDVSEVIEGVEGCILSSYEPRDIATQLSKILINERRTEGRIHTIAKELDIHRVALKIKDVYDNILLRS